MDAGSETSAGASPIGKLDYGYRPSTGVLTLMFTINGDFAFAEAAFIKTRKNDPSVRRAEGGCLEVTTSAKPDGTWSEGDVEFALPGAVTVTGGEPPYTKTFTPISMELRKTRFTALFNTTSCPMRTGRRKTSESMDAVTTAQRASRAAEMLAARSTYCISLPPNRVPS